MSDAFEDLLASTRPLAMRTEQDLALQIAVERARAIVQDLYDVAAGEGTFQVHLATYDKRCKCDGAVTTIAIVEFADAFDVIGYCDGCAALIEPVLNQFKKESEVR